MTQKEIAHQFLKMAASGNVQAAYDQYVSVKFKHHKIIEMWDLGQQIISNSPNENGLF